MSFGENIVYLRKKQQITQEELAEKMFVSRQTISRWETDSVLPDVDTIIKLCDLFNCDMDTLVRGDVRHIEPINNNVENQTIEQKQNIKVKRRIIEAIDGSIFLLAGVVYVIIGLLFDIWHPTWLIFIGAVVITGIISLIFNAKYDDIEEDEDCDD